MGLLESSPPPMPLITGPREAPTAAEPRPTTSSSALDGTLAFKGSTRYG